MKPRTLPDIRIQIENLEATITEQDIATAMKAYTARFQSEIDLKEGAKQMEHAFIAARENTVPTEGGVTRTATTSTRNTTPSVSAGSASTKGSTSATASSGSGQSATSTTLSPAGGGVTDTTTTSISNTTSPASAGSGNQVSPPALATTSQLYAGTQSQQITVPQNLQGVASTTPTLDEVKTYVEEKHNNAEDPSKKKYWGKISKQLEDGVAIDAILKEDREGDHGFTFLSDWYDTDKKSIQDEVCIDWVIVKPKMLTQLKQLKKTNPDFAQYYDYLISEIKNTNNVAQLLEMHDELFILLRSIMPEGLPASIKILYKDIVYPNLSAKKLYADVGVEMMYYAWSGTLLDTVEISSTTYLYGEIVTNMLNRTPPRKQGQWYDYDRENNPTKIGSSFWEAAIYNTENGFSHLYKTITQRNAYYRFADVYLNGKGIMSEWYDAAVRVTMYSIADAINGEVALGAAEGWNLWYLSKDTEKFLKEGNKFLFSENMENVNLLLQGKGKMSVTFIDPKGVTHSFEGLTKKELDFKLVEFEQTLVEEHINTYTSKVGGKKIDLPEIGQYALEELVEWYTDEELEDRGRSYRDVFPENDADRMQAIITQINSNFKHWMSPDLMQDIMEEHFTDNGQIVFDFAKYEDRVRLGQLLVEELYYLRLRDAYKIENFNRILKNPEAYVLTPELKKLDLEKSVFEKPLRLKEYKTPEHLENIIRIESIYNVFRYIKKGVPIAIDLATKLTEELIKLKDDIVSGIKNELETLIDQLEKVYQLDKDKKIKEFQKKLQVIQRKKKQLLKKIDHLIRDLKQVVSNPNVVIKQIVEIIDEAQEIRKLYKEAEKERDNYLPLLRKMKDVIDSEAIRIQEKLTSEEMREKAFERGEAIINDTFTEAITKLAERILPKVGSVKKTEKLKIMKESYRETVAILLYEFANGKGPLKRDFVYGVHPYAEKIMTPKTMNTIIEKTLKLLVQTDYDFISKPDSKSLTFMLQFSPSLKYAIESLDKHLDANLAQIFMGSARVLLEVREGKLEGYIYNVTGRKSLMLHLVSDLERKDMNGSKNLGNITQRIYFSFKLP